MVRRLLPLVALLLGALTLGACGTVGGRVTQSSDPLLAQASQTFEAVTSYRVTGIVTGEQGPLKFQMEQAGKDRFRIILAPSGGNPAVEVVGVGQSLFVRESRTHWDLLEPTSEAGQRILEVAREARMTNLVSFQAEYVGEGVFDDRVFALYKHTRNGRQVLHWVHPEVGVVVKTEVLHADRAFTYVYQDFNHPIRIDAPVKGLMLP